MAKQQPPKKTWAEVEQARRVHQKMRASGLSPWEAEQAIQARRERELEERRKRPK